ncbi:MAG TPA: hypothetical protein ENN08_02565 [Bacteroidales bacterium]|nr:hypothetical protein [Bacteroidales bacterium]
MRRAGRKLLITGKERCNITNNSPKSVFYKNIFPQGRFLKHAFDAFFTKNILKIIHNQGVATITERGDRIFPFSNLAADVVNAIMRWMGKKNIEILYEAKVSGLLMKEGAVVGIRAMVNGINKEIFGKRGIICIGGKSYPATGSNGDGYALAKPAGHAIRICQ